MLIEDIHGPAGEPNDYARLSGAYSNGGGCGILVCYMVANGAALGSRRSRYEPRWAFLLLSWSYSAAFSTDGLLAWCVKKSESAAIAGLDMVVLLYLRSGILVSPSMRIL